MHKIRFVYSYMVIHVLLRYVRIAEYTCAGLINYFKLSLHSAENILADIAVFLTLST